MKKKQKQKPEIKDIDPDPFEIEIKNNLNKQPISNCEASFFMHLGYKQYLEDKEKNYTQSPITPVFKEFLDYFQKFSTFKFCERLQLEELDQGLNEKKEILKNKRRELQTISEIKESELVLLINLRPTQPKEVTSWIPSLQRKVIEGNSNDINKAISIIDQYSMVQFKP